MQGPIRRLAIVNRGEAAMRAINAVRELNAERDRQIRAIALFTEPERHALFVRRADEAHLLGPPRAYLDLDALERVLVDSRADSAWVGWGFLAERPEFAELCERLGIVFVGPDAAAMRRLGDKVNAKLLAEEAGVPVAAWSGAIVDTVEDARRHAAVIGFPLMIKAVAGGGGRGIRQVHAPDGLPTAFASARAEALEAFGDGGLLLERLIAPAAHIEVQVIADGQGGAWAVGVRDCSCQRRHQKVLEESSSPALDHAQELELRASAARLVLLAGYRGAATVEFLYQRHERVFSFMEVNARLQVEHPVTEAVTGLDIVKLQLHVAEGGRLEGDPPAPRGHAIELRICAEDPALGFAPAPGRVDLLRLPTGPGIRVDCGVAQGDVVPAEFDSMIAKLIAFGSTRDEAFARARRALADMTVVIDGGTTNQGFLRALLNQPELRSGSVDTMWLDRRQLSGEIESHLHADVALLQGAIEVAVSELSLDRARFFALARRGAPHADVPLERTVELRHRGQTYRLLVCQVGPDRYRVTLDGATVEALAEQQGAHERRLAFASESHRVITSTQGADLLIEVDGVPHRIARDDGGVVRALGPCMVVALPVAAGDEVDEGDVVAVVESMKMEVSLTAPFAGRVRRVVTSPNVQVAAGAPLLQLEPLTRASPPAGRARVRFGWRGEPQERGLEPLRRLLLGYDVDPSDAARAYRAASTDTPPDELLAAEEEVLTLYADLRALTRSRRNIEADPGDSLLTSPHEELRAYLRSLDPELERLPQDFVVALSRALAHFGVDSLDRVPALETACHRLYLANQRAGPARELMMAILDRWLDIDQGDVPHGLRDVLDRLVTATVGDDQVVSDLAREVRHRWFDAPLIERASAEAYAAADQCLLTLEAASDGPARAALVDELVRCPRPLAPRLTARLATAPPVDRGVLLEVMTRRYYRVHSLQQLDRVELLGHPALQARYVDGGRRLRLTSTFIDLADVVPVAEAFATMAAGLEPDEQAVADVYTCCPQGGCCGEQLAVELGRTLTSVAMPAGVARIVVAAAGAADAGLGMSSVEIFTFLRGHDGLMQEDRVIRGIHPMMAQRLQLWRLSQFELERLPSVEDVYLWHGVAHANPADERLFAVGEVRDLTAVRDTRGQVVALPELERMLVEQLEAVRAFQADRPARRRLLWNRLLLHVWPVIDVTAEEIRRQVARLAPSIVGLGIEMIVLRGSMRTAGGVRDLILRLFAPAGGQGVVVEIDDPPTKPLMALDEGARRVIAARRRGTAHPLEIIKLLAPAHPDEALASQPSGDFREHDLEVATGRLVPVDRPPAANTAGVVTGLIRNFTDRYPEGMLRVALFGDPTRDLGAVAEPECRRIIAAVNLAEELGVPLEWFAISAGARIAMDSGTENMDWVAAVLRRIIEFTQRGGECNVVVTGINVGAQPYWNAEATMLMHTKGILVMTPGSAMVLTGKASLDYSGGVSAEDNFGIGGYDRVMGPNGQAQYWAPDLPGACGVLLRHYEHAYVAPGERFPRRAATTDPRDRDVRAAEHSAPGCDMVSVGEIFSAAANPDRKKPFDIRSVMRAVADRDHAALERWAGMRDAQTSVVWDAHLGGWPVAMVGFESRPLQRPGGVPADGPLEWTSGTLFPMSAKKVAHAVNAASGTRPLVVLANLAGFDGSPESMRRCQLEFGAELGRAVVNFDGPIVFCVVSRFHGGAFVVFSQKLNDDLETLALEGAHASVIGGAPAAAVVFAREVDAAVRADRRIAELDAALLTAVSADKRRLRAERAERWPIVRSEKLGLLAAEFDRVHSVERAVEMGSVSRIIVAASLRPLLIEAVERGMRRVLDRLEKPRA